MEKKKLIVKNDLAVGMKYELTVDSEIIDASEEGDPLYYLHGHDNIIPGLEKELAGMKLGEQKQVQVAAAEAYGELDEEAFETVPRNEFPEEIELQEGVLLHVTDEDGEEVNAIVVSIEDNMVTLNFNHPLAGNDLLFDVTIEDIREATEEELTHGHIHMDDGFEVEDI